MRFWSDLIKFFFKNNLKDLMKNSKIVVVCEIAYSRLWELIGSVKKKSQNRIG